jgi:hypothetical protein
MKYIKLFEAFESKTLSTMFKFIKYKTGYSSSSEFKNSLLNLLKNYNIPINKIKENDIDYLNKNKALIIKNDSDVSNKFRIYCLKFWFSLQEGYIGYTAVGNDRISYKKWKENTGKRFNLRHLKYIKDDLGITTGQISLLNKEDYLQFKTGDKVIGMFSSSDTENNLNRIALGTIWITDGKVFVVQNVANGGHPANRSQVVDGETVNWVDYGRYCWSISEYGDIEDDHHYLHKYIKSDKPLHYDGEEEDEEDDILDFNLPVDGQGFIKDWDCEWSSSMNSKDDLEKVDFAVIFYLDNMLDPDKSEFYENPTDIRNQRNKAKKGATKLLSDDQIKEMNIERYMAGLVQKMGIKQDITELKNLQKIVLKSLCGEFALISLFLKKPSLNSFLQSFSGILTNLIESDSESDKLYYLERLISTYKDLNLQSQRYIKKYMDSKNIILESDNNFVDVFNKIYEIGSYIYKYFDSIEINTIEDLRMVKFKLNSIIELLTDSDFNLSPNTRRIMNSFWDSSDVRYYCNNYSNSYEENKNSINKLDYLERYIKSILK